MTVKLESDLGRCPSQKHREIIGLEAMSSPHQNPTLGVDAIIQPDLRKHGRLIRMPQSKRVEGVLNLFDDFVLPTPGSTMEMQQQ